MRYVIRTARAATDVVQLVTIAYMIIRLTRLKDKTMKL